MKQRSIQVVQRFHRIYIGDSIIERIELDLIQRQCIFLLNLALLLKEDSSSSIFDPKQRYEPALLIFEGVNSIFCPEGSFYLNATIVDFEAVLKEDDNLVEFRLQMTGGFDNETFMRSLVISAQDFSLRSRPDL